MKMRIAGVTNFSMILRMITRLGRTAGRLDAKCRNKLYINMRNKLYSVSSVTMCREGSVYRARKVVLLHAVQGLGKSWNTHWKRCWIFPENRPRCSARTLCWTPVNTSSRAEYGSVS